MRRGLDLGSDMIDSRDIIDRLEEVIEEIEELEESIEDEQELTEDGYKVKRSDELDELIEERDMLESICEQGSDCEDWKYGVTLISDDYFVEYCQELVSDIGDLPRDIPSYLVIDWEATADNIRQDYTEIDVNGRVYWAR